VGPTENQQLPETTIEDSDE